MGQVLLWALGAKVPWAGVAGKVGVDNLKVPFSALGCDDPRESQIHEPWCAQDFFAISIELREMSRRHPV